jgi:hypothetical protein
VVGRVNGSVQKLEIDAYAPSRAAMIDATVDGENIAPAARPIHWHGDAIRRAANAISEVYSTDFYVIVRRFAVLWIALGTFILVGCAAAYAQLKAAYAQVKVETDRAAG